MIKLAGIDGKIARNTVFLTSDAKKVLTPKPAAYTAAQGKVELTVSYKVGTKLKTIRQEISGNRCYAAETCVNYILSGEEVADREDPNRGSDAFMYAAPELDEEKVCALTEEEKLDRYAWFVAVCNKIAETDMLAFVLENAPKKKNGTFAKNKLTVIAALPIVFYAEMCYYEIVGKAKNDNLLEISIQERKFSEDEWIRTRDNTYLQFLESGKQQDNSAQNITKVKLWHVRHGKKTTIEIPAIKLDDGKLAIAAKPYRPISDFSCVSGTDKKGYEIIEPQNIPMEPVCHNGVTTNLICDITNSAIGIWTIWSYLDEPAKYIRTGKKSYKMRTEIFTGSPRDGKIFERCMSEDYIAEIAYQLLCAIEGVYKLIEKPTFLTDVVSNAKRNKNGALRVYSSSDTPAGCAPGRKLPLVYGYVRALNDNADTLRITYGISHRHGDDWSEYEEN